MITRNLKNETIQKIRSEIEKSAAIYLTNVVGIKANDAVTLRRKVRVAEGNLIVARNTLLKKAAEGTALGPIVSDLQGPHALAFAYKDAPAVAKVLFDFSKDNELVSLQSGILGTQILDQKDVSALAKLPSRDQMLGTLLATFIAPVSAFARVLHAIKEKKESEGAAS